MKTLLKFVVNSICLLIVLTFTFSGIYLSSLASKTTYVSAESIKHIPSSVILDNKNNIIKTLTKEEVSEVTYDDLPDVFVNALISAEDSKFFLHDGIDPARVLASLLENIKERKVVQGASTITQQLVKNVYLSNEQSLERKIKEAFIAYDIEQKMSKEEILESYVNRVYFDNTTIGVNSASYKFFNKPINLVTLPEAALLAGIVNAPSLYNPSKNPDSADKRKNTVLDLMYRHGYIDQIQLENAKLITVKDLLIPQSEDKQSYEYQAYLDVVYSQIKELTGLDPFTTPMKVTTYLNSSLQKLIDNIQKNEDSVIKFTDENQQVAASVIENNTGHIIAIMGGRNYQGQRIFNRAYNMRKSPASTIKPVLSYALAIEYLNYSSQEPLIDDTYTYPNTTTIVNNADHSLLGQITLEEALGYSRNTTALATLEKVIKEIGINKVTDYMKTLNFLDDKEVFNYAYGLGAFETGVSPINLSASYSMIASKGVYYQPLTIEKIELLDNSKTFYFENEGTSLISEQSSFILTNALENIVNKNYWGIGQVSVDNVSIAAKTGTSSFDPSTIKKYNLPSNASKDIWLSGFSPSYTISVWTGFDQDGKDNYFNASNDERTKIAKQVFKRLMTFITPKNESFDIPSTVSKVTVVKGTNLLPDEYTPYSMVIDSYYKEDYLPTKTITPESLDNLEDLQITVEGLYLTISNPNKKEEQRLYSSEKIYGDIIYTIRIENPFSGSYEVELNQEDVVFPLFFLGNYKLSYYASYSKLTTFTSSQKEYNFIHTF